LANLQFPFFQIALEHAFFSTGSTEDLFQFIGTGTSRFGFFNALIESVFQQAYRYQLMHPQMRIAFLGFDHFFLKIRVSG